MRLTIDLITPTARAARLPIVAAGPLAGLALLAVLSAASRPMAPILTLVGLVMATPAGYLLDDPAAEVLAASPSTLARRRMTRLAFGAPLLLSGWLVALDRGAFLDGYQAMPLGALSVEVAAFACLTLAIAAVASGRGDRSPGITAGVGLVMVVGVLFLLRQATPPSWPVPELQANVHYRRWWWVLTGSLAVLLWSSRDPCRPGGGAHLRRST